MDEGLRKRLTEGGDLSPTCADYAELLNMVSRTEKQKERARGKYGAYSYSQWEQLLLNKGRL